MLGELPLAVEEERGSLLSLTVKGEMYFSIEVF